MRRTVLSILAFVIAAALLLSMALPANAKATRIEVSSFEYDCANEDRIAAIDRQEYLVFAINGDQ